MAKDLNDLLAIHHFLNVTLNICGGFLSLNKVLCGLTTKVFSSKAHQRESKQNNHGHKCAVVKHDEYYCNDNHRGKEEVWKTGTNHLAHCVNIIGVIAHDVAIEVRIKVPNRQVLHVREHL